MECLVLDATVAVFLEHAHILHICWRMLDGNACTHAENPKGDVHPVL